MPATSLLYTLLALTVLFVSLKLKIISIFRDFAEKTSSRFILQAILFLFPSLLLWIVLQASIQILTYSSYLAKPMMFEGLPRYFLADKLLTFVGLLAVWFVFYVSVRWTPRIAFLWLWVLYEVAITAYSIGVALTPSHLPEYYQPLASQRPSVAKMVQAAEPRPPAEETPIPVFVETSEDGVAAESFGVGKYSSIVLSNRISRRLDDGQLLFVIGHELGHLAVRIRDLVTQACVTLLAIFLAYSLGYRMIARYGPRMGVRNPQDWAGLPVFAMCFITLATVKTLGLHWYQQHLEESADCFAIEFAASQIKNPAEVAVSTLTLLTSSSDHRKVGELRLGPTSHPPLADRIEHIGQCKSVTLIDHHQR